MAYGSILETRRAELHGQVGRVIEARLPGSPGYHGMLAYHYGRAGDVDRAEEHLFLAGDDAARAGAPAEALELFQESSRLYFARHPEGGDPAKRARLHKGLAGAYFFRGQLEDANQHFNEALESLGERVPHTRVALTLGLVRTLTTVVLDVYLRGGGGTQAPPGRRPRHRGDQADVRPRARPDDRGSDALPLRQHGDAAPAATRRPGERPGRRRHVRRRGHRHLVVRRALLRSRRAVPGHREPLRRSRRRARDDSSTA